MCCVRNLRQASCARHGAKLHVLGWGEKWKGYMHKIEAMLTFLKMENDDEVIGLVDAFDTVLLQPLDVLESRFR